MRTTLDIPEELIEKVVKISGKKKKTEAIRIALEDYVRRKAQLILLNLPGKIEIEDLSEKLAQVEIETARGSN